MGVTIGIPFYNAKNTLADAIRSIFAQSYQDWELLLVDDGSTDASVEIANSVKDARVRVLSDKINKKLPYRLNQIVDEAKNEFISRMDADDLISSTKIEKQLPFFKDPRVQMVTTGICSLSNDRRPLGYRSGGNGEFTMRGFLRGYGIAHAPLLGRTSWFRRNRYDVTVPRAEDAALWCSAHMAGNLDRANVYVVEEPLYFFREHHGDLGRILKSHSDLRKLIYRYGPEVLGRWGMASELVRSHFRSAIFWTCLRMGLASRIIKRRNQAATDPVMIERLESELRTIMATKVPGLD